MRTTASARRDRAVANTSPGHSGVGVDPTRIGEGLLPTSAYVAQNRRSVRRAEVSYVGDTVFQRDLAVVARNNGVRDVPSETGGLTHFIVLTYVSPDHDTTVDRQTVVGAGVGK